MKARVLKLDNTNGMLELEYAVEFFKENDTDDYRLKEMRDYCDANDIWALGQYIYFRNEAEVTLFMLRWS
jgi:hypothetical protein